MKKITVVTLALVLSGLFPVFSQQDSMSLDQWKKALSENDEFIHAMEVLDKNVLENAKVLIHNMQTKKTAFFEMAKYHSDEIGRSLAASEDYLNRLQKTTDIAMDEIQIAYYAGLHAHYRKAIEDHRAIQEELIKKSPATSVIIMNAQKIYAEVSKAWSEQLEVQQKMDIKKPDFQPQKK